MGCINRLREKYRKADKERERGGDSERNIKHEKCREIFGEMKE